MAKDYLKEFGATKVAKFQAGGAMPEQGAPQGGGMDVEGMLMAAYESQDPAMALEVVNALVAQMGGGAPQGGVPQAGNGMRMGGSRPMFRKGGKLA